MQEILARVAEYLRLYSLMLSWSINRRKLYWYWNKYLNLYLRAESTALSTTVLIIILSAHQLS